MANRSLILAVLCLAAGLVPASRADELVMHPARPAVIAFAPVRAKAVELRLSSAQQGQACIDELEIYGPDSDTNLAAAARGATPTASSCLPGYPDRHRTEFVNDGKYGNPRSWIPESHGEEWVRIELPETATVDCVIISRDREGTHDDRLPGSLEIRVSEDGAAWHTVRRIDRVVRLQPRPCYVMPDRPNAFPIPPTPARFVRIAIRKTNNRSQPCIDELEVYGDDPELNLAAADNGGVASADGCLPGYAIHRIPHLNDGLLGNEHSWIGATEAACAIMELPEQTTIRRVVFSRDREGTFRDRTPTDFDIDISADGHRWQTVVSVVPLTDADPETPIPDETPRNWAYRIAGEIRGPLRLAAAERADAVETADGVEAVLALYRLDRDARAVGERLRLGVNPDGLRDALADMRRTFGDDFREPPGAEETLRDADARLQAALEDLEAEDPAQIRRGIEAGRALLDAARGIALANPLLGDGRLLVLKRRFPRDDRADTYWQWGQKYGFTVNWSCDFRPKNPPVAPWWDDELVILAAGRPDAESATVLKPPPGHMLQHPDLSTDARRVLFTAPDESGAFQVFEIGIDGNGLRQVTRDTGPDVDNGDACYLPDGRIVFNSTRGYQAVPCEDGESYVSNLCLVNADGTGTRMLTFDQESNWHPAVLNNGRVLYTRYEYANVSHQFGRLLFHMNPDGSGQMEYYGSNSYWPNAIFHARPIPGHPTMVAGIVCGHHGPNKTGRLVLFDPALGRRETQGAVRTIPGRGKPVERIVRDELYAEDWPKFAHPWPLNENYFLVSARLTPEQSEYAVYLVDVFDNITEICRMPGYSLFEPIPVAPRPAPPVVPDRIDPNARHATVMLSDVYRGEAMRGVPRGSVKSLRIFAYNYMYRHTLRRGFGHLATAGVDGPWEPRFLLGTVPVLPDGSALFTVPANTPVAVQPLDEEGRALQLMRSWFAAMPGERVSCVGCHEPQSSSPPPNPFRSATAVPAEIVLERGEPRGFDFEREVQPALDRLCVGCHDGTETGRPDLARKSEEEKERINREYHARTESTITTTLTPSFIALHPYVRRPHAESHYGPQVAAEFAADTSHLIQMLDKGHHGVRLDRDARERLYTWIDLGAPDHGSWKFSEWGAPADFYEKRLDMHRLYAARTTDLEQLPDAGSPLAFRPPERTPEPGPDPECPGWPFDAETAARKQLDAGLPGTLTLEPAPGLKLEFVLIPPGRFVMGTRNGPEDEAPRTVVTIDKPFYMSRCEVTNAAFRALADPEHVSGVVSWRSIDWRGEGYSLDAPEQPVVRVSRTDAERFCRMVAERTGRDVRLPTEAQWEWACRAGSDSPMPYGSSDDDFSTLENLAGRENRGFAFQGKRLWFLRDDRYDDRTMVTAPVGSYKPNAWGLCDMVGNASEWTRTTYGPSPSPEADPGDETAPDGSTETVVRGGSWFDPPRFATAGYRRKYPAWRRVHNVGFRIVLPAP